MVSGYELDDSVFENLGPEEAVRTFRDLLWATSREACGDRSDIHVPISVFEGDEGIDAVTQNADPNPGPIPDGTAGYQIKSGDLRPGKCKDELLDDDGELKPMIEEVVEENGTYVLVLFTDLTEAKHRRRIEKLREGFAEAGYPDVEAKLYSNSVLTGFFNRYPALVAKYSETFDCGIDYDTWAGRPSIQNIETFVPSEEQEDYLERLRSGIEERTECFVGRITGISGLGKSRLAHEVLAPDHLHRQVIYCDASDFENSQLQTRLEIDEDLSAILVIDDCPPSFHNDLVDRYGSRSDRLVLLTLSDSLQGVTADLQCELHPMDDETIEQILENERAEIPEHGRRRVSEFAEGFPQIADLLVQNLADDSADSLLAMSDDDLLEKLIVGRHEQSGFHVEELKQVLEVFALFERVGWRDENGSRHDEAEWLLDEFGFSDSLGEIKFDRIIRQQRDRGILQGDYYLSLRPLPLATYLMQSYWRNHGHNFEATFEAMPRSLVRRFGERIPYLNGFESGRQWVSRILGPDGWFVDDSVFYSELGSRLFLRFTEASAEDALSAANRFFQGKSADELLEFDGRGRRNMVSALIRMAVWEDCFEESVSHLLSLAEAETEHRIANNASGEFSSFFTPAPGQISKTEVAPADRLQLLTQAISSHDVERQKLGLSAAEAALETRHFSKMSGPERQGARPFPDLWTPETWEEFWDYYSEVWNLLMDELENLDESVQEDALDVLLNSSRGIATTSEDLSQLVRTSFETLRQVEWVEQGKLIQSAVRIVHYEAENLPDGEAGEWRNLALRLSESSFHSRLHRYVGLSLMADQAVGNEDDLDAYKMKIEELAAEAVEDLDLLEEEVGWLLSDSPSGAVEFGVALTDVDEDSQVLEIIFEELRNQDRSVTPRLAAGYLGKLGELDEDERQDMLRTIRYDEELVVYLPYLSLSSGLRDCDVERIFDAVDAGDLDDSALIELETTTTPAQRISEEVFLELADRLLTEDTDMGAVALVSMFYGYYVWDDAGPNFNSDLAVSVLTHQVFLENDSSVQYGQMTSHQWKEIAEALIEEDSKKAVNILDPIFRNIGNEGSLLRTSLDVEESLGKLLEEEPDATWSRISSTLDARDERMVWISNWLSGGFSLKPSTPITSIDPGLIWEWVEQNPVENGVLAARIIPAEFFHDTAKVCLAKELLRRFGDEEEVRSALRANYHSESFAGPASKHFRRKKQDIEEFLDGASDPNVVQWAEEEIANLERRIRHAEMSEEETGFSRK